MRSVHRILTHADERRRLAVRTNADTPDDSARARRFGAQGIGLCRTEHMFLGDRRQLVETLILAEDEDERNAALDQLEPLQRQDFVEIFEAMDGLPTTIRLLDPPLHEFLPDLTDLVGAGRDRRGARRARRGHPAPAGRRAGDARAEPDARAARRPARPRGARTCSPCRCGRSPRRPPSGKKAGGDPRPEIMIPLVGAVQELEAIREEAAEGARARCAEKEGVDVPATIGTMIEVPRAVLTAGEIAGAADFFSFGTNDLTQMTWGFSRDDVEAAFFHAVPRQGHLRRLAVRVPRPSRASAG